jgi:hypothetical protein
MVFEYHKDREGREGSHVSLHEEKEMQFAPLPMG